MKRISAGRLVGVVVLACLLIIVLAPSAQSHWGSSRHIHVILQSHNFGVVYCPHIYPATITVEGLTKGYKRQQTFAGWSGNSPHRVDFVFDNTPNDNYRITVQWAPWPTREICVSHTGGRVDKQEGTLHWWEREDKYYFTSP
jgi:hypothetical protein